MMLETRSHQRAETADLLVERMEARRVLGQTARVDQKPVAVCTVSGGYDSTEAYLWSLDQWPTRGLFVDYGQRYVAQERRALYYLLSRPEVDQHPNQCGVKIVECNLALQPLGQSPWIPYRNLVLAAITANMAAAEGCTELVFGSKSKHYRPEDPVSYLDSCMAFYSAFEALVRGITEPQHPPAPKVHLPLVGWSKHQVLWKLREERHLDLSRLWNCYREDGGMDPCGVCPHCHETQQWLSATYPPEQILQEFQVPSFTEEGGEQ